MFSTTIQPRFCETDALGHINNTVIPIWFEQGRISLFTIFNPTLEKDRWNLILKKYDVEFCQQIFHRYLVTVETSIERIGERSFTVYQEVIQQDQVVAIGHTVLVYFDYGKNQSAIMPSAIKEQLHPHLRPSLD